MKGTWQWIVAGAVGIAIGLAVWETAFILVPVGVVLIVLGVVKSATHVTARWGTTPRS